MCTNCRWNVCHQEKENLKLTCATSGDPKPTVR